MDKIKMKYASICLRDGIYHIENLESKKDTIFSQSVLSKISDRFLYENLEIEKIDEITYTINSFKRKIIYIMNKQDEEIGKYFNLKNFKSEDIESPRFSKYGFFNKKTYITEGYYCLKKKEFVEMILLNTSICLISDIQNIKEIEDEKKEKKPGKLIKAIKVTEPLTVEVKGGKKVNCNPGEWIIKDVDGNVTIVDDEIYFSNFEPIISRDKYRIYKKFTDGLDSK